MYKNLIIKKNNTKAGFAILFAVLLASFLITLGISIFSISLKEIMITTSVRDSQIAYYIADSARECALYWDIKKGAFPTCFNSDCSSQTNPADLINPITCNGNSISLSFSRNGSTYSASNVDFFKASASVLSPVSDISISKTFNPLNSRVVTTISAFGHNTGVLGRRVERGIQQINN